jgi:hypothetical protein
MPASICITSARVILTQSPFTGLCEGAASTKLAPLESELTTTRIDGLPLCRLEPMPFLSLQGRWVDRAGFAVGTDVRVQVKPGRLALEVMSEYAVVRGILCKSFYVTRNLIDFQIHARADYQSA